MKKFLLHRVLPVLVPVILLISLRCLIPDGRENSTDVYWHIHAADRSFSEMTAKEYPITLSIWRNQFADKELLFHVLLKGYTGIKHFFNSPVVPPFTGASLLLLLLFFSAFVYAAVKAGISNKMLWLCTLGVALFSPLFTYRLLMIRPHVLSMALMMLSCGFLFQGPGKWKTVLIIFGMGWLFAWTYSTPHLLVVTAIAFGIAYFPKEKFRALLPILSSAAGIFCGLLIHPQSPNTLTLWKIQGIDALLAPTAALGDGLIPIAQELHPPRSLWIVTSIPIFLLLYFCLVMWNRLREQKGWKEIPPQCTVCTLLALFWMSAAYMISLRPIEYAIPMLFLTLGLVLPLVIQNQSFRYSKDPKILYIAFSVLVALNIAFTIPYTYNSMKKKSAAMPTKLVTTLKTLAKPGDRVVNLDWSDFPPLVFLAPEYEFTWGLDPMFSFVPYPEQSKMLGKLAQPRVHNSYAVRRVFKAEYAVLLRRQWHMGMNLKFNSGWEVVYEGPDGWIFKLSDRRDNSYSRSSFNESGRNFRIVPLRF
ncbi:MAG: hypothetical protein E7040_00745 [Lentisphaerae bacterium]|nr:hypothetical protein [Lentisphaerota bacterium]